MSTRIQPVLRQVLATLAFVVAAAPAARAQDAVPMLHVATRVDQGGSTVTVLVPRPSTARRRCPWTRTRRGSGARR